MSTLKPGGNGMSVSYGQERKPKSKLLGMLAVLATLLGTALSQPASAAPKIGPHFSLVGFASELKINGVPYAYNAATKRFAPTASKFSPFPPTGYHVFTKANPFWTFSDGDGTGDQQVNYSNNTEQWDFVLNEFVQDIVVGNVTQIADLYHGSTRTHFGQHIAPADYLFHGSTGGVVHGLPTYEVTFLATFNCNIEEGCTGSVSARWIWEMS
jgi:hypothetical protein